MEQQEIEEKVQKGNLRCKMILEILGTPKEHVEETLRLVLKRLKDEEEVDVVSGEVNPPKEKDKLFSTFAELDILFKDFTVLTRICFDYLPSSIEVSEPKDFKIPSTDVSNFVNDMLTSLHNIDFKLKDVNAKNKILEKNSANLLKNFLLLILESRKTTSEVSKIIGINEKQIESFMQAFTQEKLIKKNGNFWEKI
ncbi:hypothetical protein CMO88_02670 [Candidatus Woesearchaeota archaeon]|nr:hypothetical protein [Candidatus Woesearchaeota archaeon]|tara:strand:- start:1609 stop:2196 length:588 start_codon:yes stop_codon:yes gene_type:complete